MKKLVAIAFLFVSLCAIGCSGDKQTTKIQQGSGASSTKITGSNP